jgi:hypothetical protein
MKNILFYFMALAAPLAAENLFSNGTMDTAGGWKGLLGICFLREAPERAIGTDRRAGKWGFLREG